MTALIETIPYRKIDGLLRVFSEGLRHGRRPEMARAQLIEYIEAFDIAFGPEAEQLADAIERKHEENSAKILNLDVPVIVAKGRTRWYSGPQEQLDRHWPRLRDYLLADKNWDPESVQSIDRQSTAVVGRLADPETPKKFSARGLVVGHVQSGKTANMTAVIAKAVDAGYSLVIVLAGLTDSLRNQTQKRLKEDLVDRNQDLWELLTIEDQDFDAGTRSSLVLAKQGIGRLAVVKKNTHILASLRDLLERTSQSTRMSMPALIIDDETDQASPDVSTQREGEDPSTINLRIREILRRLPKASYVGYTATPFANVLINPAAQGTDKYHNDLYPSDFIVSLPAPRGYLGAERLFGRDLLSADDPGPEGEGFDVIRPIDDDDLAAVLALAEGDSGNGTGIPESLADALIWFVLAAGVRPRDKARHATMLLHVSRLTDAHQNFDVAVKAFLDSLRSSPRNVVEARLRKVWEREHPRLSPGRFGRDPVRTEDAVVEAMQLLGRGPDRSREKQVTVVQDNSVSDDKIDLSEESTPKAAVVIGGDKLARGVTLPGLLVSYFGRRSKQYDTLMQMGRWFGYRDGYEELPRIWMPPDIQSAFRELATVEAEVREDIEVYRDGSVTPEEWGVRIRRVPGMLVTRPNAMRHAKRAGLAYSGQHLQTIRFYHRNREWLDNNWQAGTNLLHRAVNDPSCRMYSKVNGHVIHNVPADAVLEFLSMYQTCNEQVRMNTKALRAYIEKFEDEKLGRWNVIVMSPEHGKPAGKPLGPYTDVRLMNRSAMRNSPPECTDIKALMSRGDVLMDTDTEESAAPTWKGVKDQRQKLLGDAVTPLLILYPVDRQSEVRGQASKERVPLDAVAHVLGVGFVFPEDPRGFAGDYITVDGIGTLPTDEDV